MSVRFSKGHPTPLKPAVSTETALPGATPDTRPAKTLSGAFGAAIGGTPQLSQTGMKVPQAPTGNRLVSDAAGTPPPKNSKPGAPTAPRKGHR